MFTVMKHLRRLLYLKKREREKDLLWLVKKLRLL
jgi:hypothetical protein